MKYLTTTFSPMMLANESEFVGKPINNLSEIDWDVSAVGHENTAEILTKILDKEVEFNRTNIKIGPGDIVYCVISNFRDSQAREFTKYEIISAGFRAFKIEIK